MVQNEIYLPEFIESRKDKNSFEKLVRDEKNKWYSPTFGLNKEEFAHKNLKLITKLDLFNYFQNLKLFIVVGSQWIIVFHFIKQDSILTLTSTLTIKKH